MLTDFASGEASAPAGHSQAFELLFDPQRPQSDWQLLTPEALKKATDYAGLKDVVPENKQLRAGDENPDHDEALASLFDDFAEAGLAAEEAKAGRADGGDEGIDPALLEMAGKHEADVAALKSGHAEEVAELQSRYELEIAGLMAGRLSEIETHVASEVEQQVLAVLQSIVSDAVERESVAALSAELKEILARGAIKRVLAHGPTSLYDQLIASMGETEIEIDHVENEAPDLTVEVDHKILATRLSQWAAAVSECLS